MENKVFRIDLVKLILYVLKRIWVLILCASIGFGIRYWQTVYRMPDTYTASGTMYVYNSNPNLVNYQYTSTIDLDSAVKLIDTYMIVVKSNKVMDVVTDRLAADYPGIMPGFIASSLHMSSVSETGVVSVSSTTSDPKLSMDITNAVLDVAPEELIRVVGAGSVEVIDYAMEPKYEDNRRPVYRGMLGAVVGVMLSGVILLLLFLFNRRITDTKDLTDAYTFPVLASIKRTKGSENNPGAFLLTDLSPLELLESYAKLRMNLLYSLVGKKSRSVVITSAICGEGKSTVAANLAVSCAQGGKKTLLIEGDLRRACQRDIFQYDKHSKGLSEILAGESSLQNCILRNVRENLDILPAGAFPPNPAELLASDTMQKLLEEIEGMYDLVLLDMPPINIVSDPLALSTQVAGCLFVIRQNYSDHRDIRKALISAEMTGMNVMGFVFYGEKIDEGGYYRRKYYKSYYSKYDYRKHPSEDVVQTAQTTQVQESQQQTAMVRNAASPAEKPRKKKPHRSHRGRKKTH